MKSTRQIEVTAAFLQPGDMIIHPSSGQPAVIHRIDHLTSSRTLHAHFVEGVHPCNWRNHSRVVMVI